MYCYVGQVVSALSAYSMHVNEVHYRTELVNNQNKALSGMVQLNFHGQYMQFCKLNRSRCDSNDVFQCLSTVFVFKLHAVSMTPGLPVKQLYF